MPPRPYAGAVPEGYARRRLDNTWRAVFAISATAIVAGGAFFVIRFLLALHF